MEIVRNSTLNCRLTSAERRALEIMANRENMSKSDMVRRLIREGAEKRKLPTLGNINKLTWEA